MKKPVRAILAIICLVLVIVLLSQRGDPRSHALSLYRENEEAFLAAARSGDYGPVEQIQGVQEVLVWEDHVDIQLGGAGFGPGTRYYGVFYSADDDLCAIDVAGPRDQLAAHGQGYLYQQDGGDNRYYTEPLGDHFFYYEARF